MVNPSHLCPQIFFELNALIKLWRKDGLQHRVLQNALWPQREPVVDIPEKSGACKVRGRVLRRRFAAISNGRTDIIGRHVVAYASTFELLAATACCCKDACVERQAKYDWHISQPACFAGLGPVLNSFLARTNQPFD